MIETHAHCNTAPSNTASSNTAARKIAHGKTAARKKVQAATIVRNYTLASMGTSLIPVPLGDLVALTGFQFKMLHSLAGLYGVPFSKNIGKLVITSLMGGALPTSLALVVGSSLKGIPIIGTVPAVASIAFAGGSATYAIGAVVSLHLEAGGTFADLKPRTMKKAFAKHLKDGKKLVAKKIKSKFPLKGRHSHHHDHGHDHHSVCGHDHGHDHQHEESSCGHDHSSDAGAVERYKKNTAIGGTVLTGLGVQQLLFPSALLLGSAPLLIIAGGATLYTGFDYIRGLFKSLKMRKVNADTLVGTATVASLVLGNGITALSVIFLLNGREFLQALTLKKTDKAIKDLLEVDQNELVWMSKTNAAGKNEPFQQPLSAVQPDDVVIIYRGNRIPVDGIISQGIGTVNQAPISGESMPVVKKAGDKVYAGTILLSGDIHVKVELVGSDTVVGRIIERVTEAKEMRPAIQTAGERFAQKFVPFSFAISGAVFVLTLDPTRALTMLLIACPCAVGLSTPTAVSASIGNSAKRGILVRGGTYLESAATADVIVFDKTGTLTKGLPEVSHLVSYSQELTEKDILSLAATAELHSNHPVGGAIINRAREEQIDFAQPDSFEIIDGCGMSAEWEGHSVLVGNSRLLRKFDISIPADVAFQHAEFMRLGDTTMFVVEQKNLVGLIGVKDNLRPHVASTINQLRKQGFTKVMMLTGDHPAAAEIVAKEAGINNWRAEMTPEQKYEMIRTLQNNGYRVIMVGDGINDAPALAIADVGIALGTKSSDVAIESADLALASDDFRRLATTLNISKKTIRVIKQNYGMALGINAGGLAVGAFGYINPFMAIVLHNASTLAVLVNSSQLIKYNPKDGNTKSAKSPGPAAAKAEESPSTGLVQEDSKDLVPA